MPPSTRKSRRRAPSGRWGYAALSWRTIDDELAALVFDSASHDDLILAATRSDHAAVRAVTYASASVTIDLEVRAQEVVGQVVPADGAPLEVLTPTGDSRLVSVDDLGYFAIRPRPRGLFRLRIDGAHRTSTPWLDLDT